MRRFTVLLIATCVFAFGQARPEFEVASIKPASGGIDQVAVGVHIDGAQVSMTTMSIKDLVAMSYRVRTNQITGPDWTGSQRYNISAKLSDGAAQAQVPQMLQSLLADRFQLKLHRETRELPVYALGIAKTGLKMTEIPPDPDSDYRSGGPVEVAAGGNANGAVMNLGKGTSLTLGPSSFEAKKLDLPRFADLLSRFMDRPVIDTTGLKGLYDFTLELTPEDRMAILIRGGVNQGAALPPQALRLLDFGSNASLVSALQKVGLTFEAKTAPLEMLVIDSAQKTPTEN